MDILTNLLTIEEWHALRLSFQVATCAALFGLPFAVAIGYWLARSPIRAKWLVEVLVNLPLVLPPVVVGYLLLVCFSPTGPIGSLLLAWLGVKVVLTWWAAAMASVVVSFPLMVGATRLSFQGIDPRLAMAAHSLGAGPLRSFLTVSLPLARQGLIAGCVLGFARSLGEFGATIMVAGNIEGETRTIPLAIYTLTAQPDGMDKSWRLVGLAIILACGALGVSEWLQRRRSADAAS
jgi:molybdate transport system permease protein